MPSSSSSAEYANRSAQGSEEFPRPPSSSCPAPAASTVAIARGANTTLPSAGPASAEHHLSAILESADETAQSSQRLPLRKRFFSFRAGKKENPQLTTTSNDLSSHGAWSNPSSPEDSGGPFSPPLLHQGSASSTEASADPTPDAVMAWMSKNARRASAMVDLHAQLAGRFPSPWDYQYESTDSCSPDTGTRLAHSTLVAAVRILPEVKVLSWDKQQTFWVTVEVEGVVHDRRVLPAPTIDVITIVDNSYYVSKDCLSRALDLLTKTRYFLKKGDRCALFTTHCTHETVTGNVPDMWSSLELIDDCSHDSTKEFIDDIRVLGTQTWQWPRPNPSMTQVIQAIVKSLEHKDLKEGRTLVLLLSPKAHSLSGLPDDPAFPMVHQINPACLPFTQVPTPVSKDDVGKHQPVACSHNTSHYQSRAERIKHILRDARSEKPSGSLSNLHVDLRRRPGCEIVKIEGNTDISALRHGQVHAFSAQLNIVRDQTRELDVHSVDPVRDSYLKTNNLRSDLYNAAATGASRVHLLSVQLMHQNSLLPINQWTFLETPLFVIRDLGRLTLPTDRAFDVYKRRFFHVLSRMDTESALLEVDNLHDIARPDLRDDASKVLERMKTELEAHKAVLEHEATGRQNLPGFFAPVSIPPIHPFLVGKWESRKLRKNSGFQE